MGAFSGIGEATTKKLAQEGAKIDIAARREVAGHVVYPGSAVSTDIYTTINDPEYRERVKNLRNTEGLSIESSDVSDAVAYAINTPETVAVSEILIRRTK